MAEFEGRGNGDKEDGVREPGGRDTVFGRIVGGQICSSDLNLPLRGENFSVLSQVDPWPDLGNLLKYVHKAQLLQGDLGQGV